MFLTDTEFEFDDSPFAGFSEKCATTAAIASVTAIMICRILIFILVLSACVGGTLREFVQARDQCQAKAAATELSHEFGSSEVS